MSAPQELLQPPQDASLSPATMADVSAIRELIQQASGFKMSQGDDLWGGEPFTDDEVGRMIESGNMFVHKSGDVPVASVLLLEDDARMWGDEQGSDQTALYVHKLCVGDKSRGHGKGKLVMEQAEKLAKSRGKSALRLDCPYDNRPLCGYYESLGFREVRRYDRPLSPGRRNPDKDVFHAALYEKAIE